MGLFKLFKSPKLKNLKRNLAPAHAGAWALTRARTRARPRILSKSQDLVTGSNGTTAGWLALFDKRNYSRKLPQLSGVTPAPKIKPLQGSKINVLPNLYTNLQTAESISAIPNQKSSICSIRQERKEVLFATKKAGKSGQKRKQLKSTSRIICE